MSLDECNKDIMDTSRLITKEFLEQALQCQIENYSVSAGSNPGDNFTSILYAIQLKSKDKSEPEHLVLKVYPNLPARQKFLNETNLFSKEIQVYTTLIPSLSKVERNNNNGRHYPVHPPFPSFVAGKAIDYTKELEIAKTADPLENYLMLVDVRKCGGYKMVEKGSGLDLEHAELVIKQMALFHSLGWNYRKKRGLESLTSQFPFLQERCFTTSTVEMMLSENFKLVEQAVESGPYQSAAGTGLQKLKDVGLMNLFNAFLNSDFSDPQVRQFLDEIIKVDDSESWTVCCHGDCWVNNMLFKYDQENGPPVDMIFVDLQLCRETCPTADLAYMFYTSTTYELRKDHMERLLRLYCDEFARHCQDFGTSLPEGFNFKKIWDRMRRAKVHGILSGCLILPIILSEAKDPNQVLESAGNGSGGMGGDDDDDLTNAFKALTANSAGNRLLMGRLNEIIHELLQDGIF